MRRTADCRPMIRWAGSKRKLVRTLLRHVPSHTRYVEPFAGSACLFFALTPDRAVLGDINRELIETYDTVRNLPVDVGAVLNHMPLDHDYYYSLRDTNTGTLNVVERAARFLYLNRFCFNGVYRTNRNGKFNVPRGIRTGSLPSVHDLMRWSDALKNVQFVAGDFRQSVAPVKKDDFVYLDPPYSRPGTRNRGEYGCHSFADEDMPYLAGALEHIDRAGASFLLSYRYSKAVNLTLSAWHRRTLTVRRHVAGFVSARRSVRGTLFSNRPFSGSQSLNV